MSNFNCIPQPTTNQEYNLINIGILTLSSSPFLTKTSTLHLPKITRFITGYFNNSNTKLTNISCPQCLEIGTSAFKGCTTLETISFDNCITIQSDAFNGCTNLSGTQQSINDVLGINGEFVLVLPKVERIGADAFKGTNIKYVLFGTYCSNMANTAFDWNKITTIFIPTKYKGAYELNTNYSSISSKFSTYG